MDQILKVINGFHADNIFRAILLLGFGYLISRLISASLNKRLAKHLRPHQVMLLRRTIFFILFMLFFASAAQQIGFRVSALLGATGILTVALGIASQTSMSNLISGLFIIGEKPFEIGDNITVNTISGEVVSINFMSVQIRTVDNTMVRVPNETLIKSSITNLTWFPTRRLTVPIAVSYKDNILTIKELLLDAVKKTSLALKDPAPSVLLDNFGESAINLHLLVWTKTSDIKELRDNLQTEIKILLGQNNIEIAYAASKTLTIDSCVPLQITENNLFQNKTSIKNTHEN